MTVVNLGEAIYTLEDRRSARAAAAALANIGTSAIALVGVDRELAIAAARLKADRHLGYLDCFAAALAQSLGGTLVTGDQDFRRVEDLVPIEWLAT